MEFVEFLLRAATDGLPLRPPSGLERPNDFQASDSLEDRSAQFGSCKQIGGDSDKLRINSIFSRRGWNNWADSFNVHHPIETARKNFWVTV